MAARPEIRIASSAGAWPTEASAFLATLMAQALAARGECRIALSGGSTPGTMFDALVPATKELNLDWTRVFVILADERMVPGDHPDSNIGMIRKRLLDRVSIPPANIESVRTDLHPVTAAVLYARTMQNRPPLDVAVLGLGADGHTASLFPGSDAVFETSVPVRAVFVRRLAAWRVTLTLPYVNAARSAVFLVTGREKAPMVKRVIEGRRDIQNFPASGVDPDQTRVVWLLDPDAATELA